MQRDIRRKSDRLSFGRRRHSKAEMLLGAIAASTCAVAFLGTSAEATTFVSYNFDSSNGNVAASDPSVTASTFAFSGTPTYSGGNPSSGKAISGTGFTATTYSNASTAYFSFSLTPTGTTPINIGSLTFDDQASSTGAKFIELAYSLDAKTSDEVAVGSIATATSFATQVGFTNLTSIPALQQLSTGSVTFYLVGFGASGGSGTLRLDNVLASGSTGAAAIPPATVTWNVNSGTWDTVSPNWTGGNPSPTLYKDSDFANFTTRTVDSTVTVQAAGVSPGSTTISNTAFTYTFNGGPILSGSLAKSGAGTLVLGMSNSYTGGTTVTGGLLQTTVANALPSSGALAVAAGATVDINGNANTVTIVSLTGGIITTEAGTLTASAITVPAGSTTTSIISGNLSGGTASGTLTVTAAAGTGTTDLDIQANLSGTKRVSFVGPGTISLEGSNASLTNGVATGTTTFLVLGTSTALGGTGTQTFMNGGTFSASVPLTASTGGAIANAISLGGNVSFVGSNPLEFSGAISPYQSTAKTITVTNSTTFSGVFSDGVATSSTTYTGSLIKAGTGTLIVTAADTNTGTIGLTGGSLTIGANGSFNAITALNVTTSASVSPTLTLMNATSINDAANVIVTGGGTFTISLVSGNETINGLNVNGTAFQGMFAPGDTSLQAAGLYLVGDPNGELTVLNSVAVPEPVSIAFIPAAAFFALRRRRRAMLA